MLVKGTPGNKAEQNITMSIFYGNTVIQTEISGILRHLRWSGYDMHWLHALLSFKYYTLIPSQDSRHLADDILKFIFVYENNRILIQVWLKFVS